MYGKNHHNIVNYPPIKVNTESHSKLGPFYQHWSTEHRGGSSWVDSEGFVNLQGDTLHGLVSASRPYCLLMLPMEKGLENKEPRNHWFPTII